jgi:molybdate transport system regulatory protein
MSYADGTLNGAERINPKMRKPSPRSLPSLSIRIDLDEGRIGPGKVQLLENIRSCGSIIAAGRAMNMSYRRAWGLVDEINRICNRTAVQRWEGGKGGGGAMLTPFGESLVARYRKIERLVGSAVHAELLALLGDDDAAPSKPSQKRASRH